MGHGVITEKRDQNEQRGQLLFVLGHRYCPGTKQSPVANEKSSFDQSDHMSHFGCFPSLILSSVTAGMVKCMVTLPPTRRWASLLGQHPYPQDWPFLPLILWQLLGYGHSVVDTTLQAQREPFLQIDWYRSECYGQSTITSNHFLFSLPFIISSISLQALSKEEELKTESRTFSDPVLLSQLETQQRTLALGLCHLPAAQLLPEKMHCSGCSVVIITMDSTWEGGGWLKDLCRCTFIRQPSRNSHETVEMLPGTWTHGARGLRVLILESSCHFYVPLFLIHKVVMSIKSLVKCFWTLPGNHRQS